MILGIGTDIVEIERVSGVLERHGEAFKAKVFTAGELALAEPKAEPAAYFAGRWAAKEAVAKALGCGFGADCGWLDVEIINNEAGKPEVSLHNAGAVTAQRMGVDVVHVSISHERSIATAYAVAEGRDQV
jgi:holo-[acyl-carrier protein] synthase